MKTKAVFGVTVALVIRAAISAEQTPAEPVVVDRGSSHRLWMRTTQQILPSGDAQSRNTFTCELATGIHFKQPTQDRERGRS